MPRITINDSSEQELFTASNPGQVAVASGATSKVDANMQVGDVDVSASNPMPVQQNTKTWTPITGTTAASGQTELVAAPGAGSRIVVSYFAVQNLSAVATSVTLDDGATAKHGSLLQTQGANLSGSFFPGYEWRLSENAALNVTLSTANSHRYNVGYFTELV